MRNSIDYIYYTPMYITILIIYAFCRIDDLSWGTRGNNGKFIKSNSFKILINFC